MHQLVSPQLLSSMHDASMRPSVIINLANFNLKLPLQSDLQGLDSGICLCDVVLVDLPCAFGLLASTQPKEGFSFCMVAWCMW